jgi:geranyl-CoA carboxylase alpha subunit
MTVRLANLAAMLERRDEAGGGRVTAPMHGRLLEILVAPGDTVHAGDRLAVLEAMKMQHALVAEIDGTIGEIAVEAGAQIAADDPILDIVADTGEPS